VNPRGPIPVRFIVRAETAKPGLSALVLIVLAGVAAWASRWIHVDEGVLIGTRIRAVAQGYVFFEQNRAEDAPQLESDWTRALLRMGFVPVEFFEHPRFPGVPLFFCVRPTDARERRWQRAFTSSEIILVQNPATVGPSGGMLGFNDCHVDLVPEPRFSEIVAELRAAGRLVEPVR
jgi:hypothetical protein